MNQKRVSLRFSSVIALLCAVLVFQIKPSLGGPGSVLNAIDPLRSAPALESRDLAVGDMTVASRTGAFEYSYPIAVPQGRLGNQPGLVLSYSSQGAIRGGIAAGWSLSIPEIKLEFPNGRSKPGVYVSSMSGGHRLVQVQEPAANVATGLDTAYRAEYDDQYIRYSIDETGDSHLKAVAMTLDGMTYLFGDKNSMGLNKVDATRWPLTRTEDKFGNVVEYEYAPRLPPSGDLSKAEEFILHKIQYGRNDSAGLGHFASIYFMYATPPPCPGSSVTAGASLNHRWKQPRTRGNSKLIRIATWVKDTPGSNSRAGRVFELGYDSEAEKCDANHGPLRMLTSITEHAPASTSDPDPGVWSPDNPNPDWISKPPVTFSYGPLTRSWNTSNVPTGLSSLGKGSRLQSQTGSTAGLTSLSAKWPTLDQMLLDINGDGIVDRINSVQPSADNNFQCQMRVRLGDGTSTALADTAASDLYDLPTLPWANEETLTSSEGCSLSGQYTFHETRQLEELCGNIGSYLAYRFMDMNADGLPDLVTEISSDPVHFMAWDPDSGVDDTDLPPYDPDILGSCPLVAPELLATAEVCGERDYCTFDQEAVKEILDTAEHGACGYLLKDNHPDPFHKPFPKMTDILEPKDPDLPPPDDEPDCGFLRERKPQIHNGRYVWRWYENIDGALSTQRQLTMSPIPLTANAGDSGFGKGPLSNSSDHGIYDINGDGFIDAISKDANAYLRTEQGDDWYNPKFNPLVWWVWLGDGKGGFDTVNRPIAWKIPVLTNLSRGEGGKFLGGNLAGRPDYFVGGRTTVKDVNGDGLVDLLKFMKGDTASENKVYVFLNTGVGFRSEPFTGFNDLKIPPPIPAPHIAWPYLSGANGAEIDWTSFDVTDDLNDDPSINFFLPQAERFSRLMIADVDGDGIPDVHTKGTGRSERKHSMHYGAADGRLLAAISAYVDAPQRQLNGDNAIWSLVSDYIDINGDGVMDQVVATLGKSKTYLTDDYNGHPMRLMVGVNNGNGLATDIRYAPNNSAEVAVDPYNIKGMPNHVRVVKSVKRSESLPEDYVASSDSIVEVKYGAPVWNEDNHGHWGFRGFETIEISAAHAPDTITGFSVTDQKYDFTLDWSGRLKETVLYVDGFPVGDGSDAVASISKSYWIERAVTDGMSLSYVKNRENTRDCETIDGNFQSESTCATSPIANETRFWHAYYRHFQDNAGPYLMSREERNWQTPTGHFSSYVKEGSILNQQVTRLYSDEDRYHMMTISEIRFRANGNVHEMVAKTTRDPDPTGRFFENERVHLDNASQGALLTAYQRDPSTGLLTSRQKPAQVPQGPRENYAYSGFKVTPSSINDEFGRNMFYQTDLRTGQTTVTKTPNTIICGSDTDDSGPAGTESKYDGFGRPLDLSEYGCDNSDTYAPIRVKRFEYKNYDETNLTPASVLTHSLIAYSGAEAESESYFDGYGRLIRTRLLSDNGNTNTLYEYGVNGKIRRHKTPNPSENEDSKKSEFTYRYDSLARQIGMRVPDSSGAAPDPGSDSATWDNFVGVNVSYGSDGSETVTIRTEHVLDGSAASETATYHNNFGQLTRVDELLGDGTSIATTTYQFDGNGNLSHIVDADGLLTTMEHDWTSRRTKIVRGAREWKFEYDLNSNVVLETAPLPAGANETDYQTLYVYDVLDRVKRVASAPRDLSGVEQDLFGVNIPTIYTYDTGFNAIGRVSSVDGPFYRRSYTYDFAGRIASEQFDYDVSTATGISGKVAQSRSHSFRYNAAGAPTHATTADSMLLRYEYDSAGRQKRLLWDKSDTDSVNVAEFTRSFAGNVTFQRSGCVVREWNYDPLGRVTGTQVRKDSSINCDSSVTDDLKISESMFYFDSNEVKSINVVRSGFENRTLNFGYDSQHQLITAFDNVDEYRANFAYTGAGRIENADVDPVNSAPLVIGREVSYDYGDHVTVDGHAVEALNNNDGSLNTAYGYDLSGNVIKRHEDAQNNTWSFRYDGDDRQRIVTGPSGNDEIYYYDENGQRYLSFERSSNGNVIRSRFWFGDSEFWFDGDGQVEKKMTNMTLGAIAVAQVDNENDQKDLEYSFHNGLGHMMGALDTNGDITTAYVYGPYGEILQESGETTTHLRRFNGKEADQLSRLNYYGFRYYDPLSLTWTQSDPLYRVAPDLAYDQPRLMSLYAFSLNNPVRYLDPDGRAVLVALPVAEALTVALVKGAAFVGSALLVAVATVNLDDLELPHSNLMGDKFAGMGMDRDMRSAQAQYDRYKQNQTAARKILSEIKAKQQQSQTSAAKVREAELQPNKDVKAGPEISVEDAVEIVSAGGDVIADTEGESYDIANAAGEGEPKKHGGHDRPTKRPNRPKKPQHKHHHPTDKDGTQAAGHVFY